MPKENKQYIPIGCSHYFSAGFSREEALELLTRSQERHRERFPTVDYREIDFWYRSFEKGNFNYSQEFILNGNEASITSHINSKDTKNRQYTANDIKKASLAGINTIPLSNVVRELNVDDELTLSGMLRNFHNRIYEPDRQIFEKLQFNLRPNSVFLLQKNYFPNETSRTTWTDKEEGCEVKKNGVRSIINENFVTAALKKFRESIQYNEVKIKFLEIKCDLRTVDETNRELFIGGIFEAMNDVERKLHVENLKFSFKNLDELNAILSHIKVGPLLEMDLGTPKLVFNLDQVAPLLAHFPHLERFSAKNCVLEVPLDRFTHLKYIFVERHAMDVEEMKAHMNRIQNDGQRHVFYINAQFDRRTVSTALQPDVSMIDDEDNGDITGRLRIPGSTTHQIEFTIGRMITLKITKITKH
uniref:FTH domain-containing protein n=1 Tax=Caenorhabditis tropicalis TaxID=1561998 RepID=A0A1I7U0Y5_9PELO